MTDFHTLVPAADGRFDGIERPYTAAEVETCADRSWSSTPWRGAARTSFGNS